MQIIPAIGLRSGQCVRLRQGDFAQETVFDSDPVAVARRWVSQGATALHIVDLDGARIGHPVHSEMIRQIVGAAPVTCQVGGGLRSDQHIEETLVSGASRVVIGTRALLDPQWFRGLCDRFAGNILLGLDARDDKLATHGWVELTEESPVDVARKAARWPIAGIVYTDINREGMMTGPDVGAYSRLREAVAVPVFAAGGVSSLDHVRALAAIGIDGCIVGRALYENQFSLTSATTEFSQTLEPATHHDPITTAR